MSVPAGGVRPLAVAVRGGPVPVPVTWTGPADGRARGVVLLVHGFTRAPRHLDGLAAALADAGLATARPHLSSLRRGRSLADAPFLTGVALAFAAALEDADEAAARGAATGVHLPAGAVPLVAAGHSAGAAVAVHVAAVLAERGGPTSARGLVLLDGVDSRAGLVAAALPALAAVPVRVIAGPPSRCNRHGALTDLLAGQRRGFLGVGVRHGGHGDVEDDHGGRPPAVYRASCGDATAPEDRALVRRLTVAWAGGLAADEADPAPGPGDEGLRRWVADGRLALLHGRG